jgi:fatty acid desaturase
MKVLFRKFWYLSNESRKKRLNPITMKKNMGSADRIIRILAAIVFVALYFGNVVTGTWGVVLLVLAGVFVLTSLVSYCPLYVPIGMSTCASKDEK